MKPAPDWEESRLAGLHQISRDLGSRLDIDSLLPLILQSALDSVQAQSGSVIVLDAHGQLRHSALLYDGEFRQNYSEFVNDILERGLAGWVVRRGEGVLIPNTSADPRWYPHDEHWLSNPKSVIAVPLLGRERVIGALTVGRLPVGAFSSADLALIAAIAAQAGIAIENAQLFAAVRDERDFSNALRDLARSINATLDLDQVLNRVLEHVMRQVDCDSASVLVAQAGRLRVAAMRGFADPGVLGLSFDLSHGLAAQAMQERRCVVVADVKRSAGWQATGLEEVDLIRAWVGAPLVAQDEVLGLLAVDSRDVGAFTAEAAQRVVAFAEQAATAVLNARLYAQSERRAYGLRALAATAQAINATLDLGEVLRLVVRHAQQWLGMEGASLALIDGDHLVFNEAVGSAADYLRGMTIKLGAGIAGWVAQHNEPIIAPDVSADARFFGGVDQRTGYVTRALACVPVRLQGQVIGVIEVVNPASGAFDPETLDQLDSLASLAGTAIAQARRVADLQAAENRFAGLFEDSTDPIVITDLDGLITDANRRATDFFGYERAGLLGVRVTQLHRVRTDVLTRGRFAPLLNGRPILYQTRIVTHRGSEVVVEVHAKLIERGGQQFVQWVHHDLTERLALEELRNDLVSMIVHDLRSPLGNILSALDILASAIRPESGAAAGGPPDEAMLTALVSIATRAARRLSRLVDSLLDLRRLEAGEMALNRTPIELAGLLADAADQLQPAAAVKSIAVRVAVAPGLPGLLLDGDLIRRVAINLLENAVRYTPSGGAVALAAAASAGQVTLTVSDTGPGVAEADRERIFDKFARGHASGPSGSKGLGLGLAFCRLAVEAHGGRIWVEAAPGGGACFIVALPVVSP